MRNTKGATLTALAATLGNAQEYTSPTTTQAARDLVAYLYRAIDIRGKTLQQVPYGLWRGEDDLVESQDVLVDDIPRLLYLIECSLVLEGVSYLRIIRNVYGRNPALQWLAPQTMTPKYDMATGEVTYYQRAIQSGVEEIPPEEVVAILLPDPYTENSAGLAPAIPALKAAAVLSGIDEFSRLFFERGATKAMLLTVDGSPTPEQVQKLESWWARFLSGIKNAYKSVVISAAVAPVIVGDGLSDLDSDKVVTPRRQDILAALGVPESQVTSSAANYATSRQDRLTFLQSTIVPEAHFIAAELNKQFYHAMGLDLVFDEAQMEEYQAWEVEKAASLLPLFDAGVLTRDEVRATLGYEPLDAPAVPSAPTLPTQMIEANAELTDALRALRDAVEREDEDEDTARLELLMEELKTYEYSSRPADDSRGTEEETFYP